MKHNNDLLKIFINLWCHFRGEKAHKVQLDFWIFLLLFITIEITSIYMFRKIGVMG